MLQRLVPLLIFSYTSSWNAGVGQAQESAELAITNVRVWTANAEQPYADSLAISQGRVLALGQAQVVGVIGPATRTIDAGGQLLTPGLIDSHLHFVGLGESLQMLDLKEATSWEAIVDQVRKASELLPAGTWIQGRGWHQSKWTAPPADNVDGYPHHASLSAAVPDHPVVLTHASGHACFANAAAMRLAGVDRSTSDPPGGEILKTAGGNPMGVFRENAQGLIRRAQARGARALTAAERLDVVREQCQLAGRECLRQGITSVHDAGSSFAGAARLKQLADRGELPVRMVVMIREGSESLYRNLAGARVVQAGDGFLRVASVKVSIDGALGPHGAWLLQPYTDLPESSGLNTVSLDELTKIAQLCKQHQWQLCVHAIGDRANREVLDVYEKVLADDVAADHRWRIEHAQHLDPADIPRFGQLGVIPAMQANHCTSDAVFVPARLGERRSAQGAYVWRSLLDSGAMIPNGTDAPVERVDPRVSLYASVTRRLANGEAFYPEQCMTRQEALLSYTLWPAKAAFQEEQLGSLDVGKRADCVLWDTDLLNCQAEELLSAKVQLTILGGQVVFDAADERLPK